MSASDTLDAKHLGPEQVERYLRRHGLEANRRMSQNHLVDGEVLEAIIDAAVPAGRTVLEIGPGIGILTGGLLGAGAERVVSVEIDRRLIAHLRERFEAEPRLEIIEGDYLDTDVSTLVTPPYDLIANLPYHITSPVLHQALGEHPRPERFVLMLQREVAERVCAAPGRMSYLSVFVQYHADVSLLRVVPASAFEPSPKVDSAVVVGAVRDRRLGPEAEEELWRLVQAGFRERRKMIQNVLVRQLPALGRDRIMAALTATGIAPDLRPQALSVDTWMALAVAIGPLS
ncbi:MAG: 16S rRNA (adenine(1518)-N(6)/adenine(1519)-N(6))-dimethyltransferase RsmA [Candidatus Limnocylindrales bacterium]